MFRGSRPQKVEEWTSRLGRYAESGQTVAEFCQCESISQPSFYQWKKKLESSPGGFQPVRIASFSKASHHETIVRLGRDIEIELGSDLSIVKCVVQQLLAASVETSSVPRGKSC